MVGILFDWFGGRKKVRRVGWSGAPPEAFVVCVETESELLGFLTTTRTYSVSKLDSLDSEDMNP